MTVTETRKAVSIEEVRRHLERLKSERPAEVVEGELSEVEQERATERTASGLLSDLVAELRKGV
ncbi:MAG: hypothetical protein VCA36_06350 [Opitutales bacterium]